MIIHHIKGYLYSAASSSVQQLTIQNTSYCPMKFGLYYLLYLSQILGKWRHTLNKHSISYTGSHLSCIGISNNRIYQLGYKLCVDEDKAKCNGWSILTTRQHKEPITLF